MGIEAILKGGATLTGRYKNFVRTTEAGVNRMYELVNGEPVLRRAAKVIRNNQNWGAGSKNVKCYEIQSVKTYPANESGMAREVRRSSYYSKASDKLIDSSVTTFEVPANNIPAGKDFCIGGIKKPGMRRLYEGTAYLEKGQSARIYTEDVLSNCKIWDNVLTKIVKR